MGSLRLLALLTIIITLGNMFLPGILFVIIHIEFLNISFTAEKKELNE